MDATEVADPGGIMVYERDAVAGADADMDMEVVLRDPVIEKPLLSL